MRIRQYVHFDLVSGAVTAAEMTARLGLEPDEVWVKGSRNTAPPRPVSHAWTLTCRDRGLRVDEQIAEVMGRLLLRRDQIVELARELAHDEPGVGGAKLSVARYFDDEDGETEQLSPPDAPLRKLAGQHQLLGWYLEPSVMEFLVATNAGIDVDEYN